MQLLDDSLWDLYSRGVISPEDLLEHAQRREELEHKLAETSEGREVLRRLGGPTSEADAKTFQKSRGS
jgi:Tfp pilus assembly ATPase PilU